MLIASCATPEYAVRGTPTPVETPSVLEIEHTISAQQAKMFEKQGARPVRAGERVRGMDVQGIADKLSRVTERPYLNYQVNIVTDKDPNAAALADGRIYITTGMLEYLASRGSNENELAFILGHELAHTVAQHLVQRYEQLQKQQLLVALVSAGASAATRGRGPRAQQLGALAQDAAGLGAQAALSQYSQQQELEADQLGIRYVMRAGYNPKAALDQLQDFQRYDSNSPFLRTHPYMEVRRQYLERYLQEIGVLANASVEERRRRMLDAQKLYPVGSQSWKNIQGELDKLEGR